MTSISQSEAARETCPYCSHVPGVGAGPWQPGPFDEPIEEDASSVLVPTLGMLAPGYLLAVSKIHVNSYGALGRSSLNSIQGWVERMRLSVESEFGETFVFEHGSATAESECGRAQTRACIVHAHMHLVPVPSAIESIMASLQWTEIGGYSDLAAFADVGYAFLEWRKKCLVAPAVHLEGQWIRRRIAAATGTPDLWDYEAYRGSENLKSTLSRWGGTQRRRKSSRIGNDPPALRVPGKS